MTICLTLGLLIRPIFKIIFLLFKLKSIKNLNKGRAIYDLKDQWHLKKSKERHLELFFLIFLISLIIAPSKINI